MKRFPIFSVLIFLWLLAGCGTPEQQDSMQAESSTPTKTSAPTLVPTLPPTLTPTSTPTPTPTPLPLSFVSTSLDQPGNWEFGLPYINPSLPELFLEGEDGYSLEPSFELSSIEMSYEWWGLGEPMFDYQLVERKGDRFWKGDSVISAGHIEALLQSVANLYPGPQMLYSITHTDDYPIWTIELVGVNGERVLIHSQSNTFDLAPWNVIYNGQIYSQFNGKLSEAIAAIFSTDEGQPMAWTGTGEYEEGYLYVESIGWPAQLSYGFNGLIPVQSAFNYSPNPEQNAIVGYLEGRSSIGGMGHMIIGSITELDAIRIEVSGDQMVTCTLESLESYDPAAFVWGFECLIPEREEVDEYSYPIEVSFTTDQNRSFTTAGNLFGSWEQAIALPVIALPDEIHQALQTSAEAKDLLSDHQIVAIQYQASADPQTGLLDHNWLGEIALLGQVDLGGRILPYSISLKVGVIDSNLTKWDLDRDELKSLLMEVLEQPITQRFLDGDPNLVLNVYYGEGEEAILWRGNLPACADLPYSSRGLPTKEIPLRGFALNRSWSFSGMQVVLFDGGSRITNLRIHSQWPEDSIWASLLPEELTFENAPPFNRIEIWPWSPVVAVVWDENSSSADIEVYKSIADNWSGPKEIQNWGIMFEPAMLGLTDDGRLELIDCNRP